MSRIRLVSTSIENGLVMIAMPSSSGPLPITACSAWPVMNSTGKFGLTARAASATCRPFSPPGRPTSVTSRSIRASGSSPASGIGIGAALIRYVVMVGTLGLAVFWMLADANKQGLHDKAAKSFVVTA